MGRQHPTEPSDGVLARIHDARGRQESGMRATSPQRNLAARMAIWSGRHRKKAIWGWLAFVLVVFAAGTAIGTTNISEVDQFSGESHRAEVALHNAGMRPVEEVVFLQSDKLTIEDPGFRAAVRDVTSRLTQQKYVSHVKSPLTGASPVAAGDHAALWSSRSPATRRRRPIASIASWRRSPPRRPGIRAWTSGSLALRAPGRPSTRSSTRTSPFASLTVLPAMLSWLGDRVEKGRVPLLARRRRPAGQSRVWTAVTSGVMRRPALAAVVAGGLLVALAIPALQMKIVTSGVDQLPQDLPIIVTYDKVKAIFPTKGVVATVVVQGEHVRAAPIAAGISAMRKAVIAAKAFRPGAKISYSKGGTVAQVDFPTPGSGNDAPSLHALSVLRNRITPATIGRVEGATVNVTGDAADSKDYADQLKSRLPLIFVFVLGLAFMLLLVTFRSIVIPIKAIVLNLLSVGAAYGVLVLVFQQGHGESLLGFTSNRGVSNWLPLFLFVVLFGLSMDYHVFILSRVSELWDRGMPTDEAVRRGISTTPGTVTSAAAVMIGVFAVFMTLTFLDFKEMGLGLAAAVLIDATIIRGVLLPASMRLLGDWNWYLPRWLQWLPRIGAERDVPPSDASDPRVDEPEATDAPAAPVPA